MKPFDLEAAKAGAPIITRNGSEAKFVAHVPEADHAQRVVILVGKSIHCYPENGIYFMSEETQFDLVMKPQKRTVWVNIVRNYVTALQVGPQILSHVYFDEGTARKAAEFADKVVAVAVPVEIEE